MANFARYYNSPDFSDMKLRVGDKEMPAHKIVLAAKNKILDAWIRNIDPSQELIVDLKRMNSAFLTFIKFLYLNNVNREDVDINLLIVANHFDDSNLKHVCKHYLQQLNDENVPMLLNVSKRYSYKQSQEKANQLLQAKTSTESTETVSLEQISSFGSRSGLSWRKSSTTIIEMNISNLTTEVKTYSDVVCFNIRDQDWGVYARRCKIKVTGEYIPHLGLYLKKFWRTSSEEKNCLLNVTFIFTLMSTDKTKNVTRSLGPVKFEENGKHSAYGTPEMLPFSDLLDSTNGYIKNDVISIRISIHTDVSIPKDAKTPSVKNDAYNSL